MSNHSEKIGERYIIAEAISWSLFPIVTGILVISFSPIFSLGLSMLFASIFFAVMLTIQKKWDELRLKSIIRQTLLMTLLIGTFYMLFFVGLQFTSPSNASIISLMEVFFTMFLLSAVTKKEVLNSKIIFGGILMVVGAFFIIFKGSFVPNKGDIIILGATALPPFANHIAKKIRSQISPHSLLFVRNMLIGTFLLILSYFFEGSFPSQINMQHILLFAINGIFLFGLSKVFWIEAIHRMTITKTISLASLSSVFTLFFVYLIYKTPPSSFQLLGLIPILIGVYLLTHSKFQTLKNPV